MSYYVLILVVFLAMGASLCSGLNLGMLALDKVRLQALMKTGTAQEKKYVERLRPLLEDRHLFIATILLGNALCTEMLPEMLDDLIGQFPTIIVCTIVVVIFCEVLPQAIFMKNGLKICANLAFFTWALIFLFFVVTFPLARLLDLILGKDHVDYYSREELAELVTMHATEKYTPNIHQPRLEPRRQEDLFKAGAQMPQTRSQGKLGSMHNIRRSIDKQKQSGLTYDEVSIIQGIFLIHKKQVGEIMKPLEDVFMMDYETILNRDLCQQIYDLGYSRIPVYFKNKQNIMGILMTKQLIKHDPDEEMPLSKLEIHPRLPLIPKNCSLARALSEFEKGTHIAGVVSEQNFRIEGMVTLEDVLEQLLQEQIYDESDARRAVRGK